MHGSRRQRGFTLIEVVIAFTILSMCTVLVVNMVTQSSMRVDRVNGHLAMMNTMESAIALLRGEMSRQAVLPGYQGEAGNGGKWSAEVLDRVNPEVGGVKRHLALYRVRIRVFDDAGHPALELVTVVSDR